MSAKADDAAPLAGVARLRVVDFGMGLAAALVARQFADLGARIDRIEPDGGDPFYETYPAYRWWRRGAQRHAASAADGVLADADVCIVGGEDHPDLPPTPDAQALSARYPRLVVLRLVGYAEGVARTRPAVDLLVQARSGVVYEQFSQRPIVSAFPMPSYGAALQGLIGAWVALVERERSGRGQVATVSLAGGAAMFWGPFWMQAEKADAGFLGITPRDVRQLILRCVGDEFVQLTLGVPGAVAKVYRTLGIPDAVDATDRGMPDPARGPANFYGNFDLLNTYAQRHRRDELVRALREAGVAAEAVLPPGACWQDEQTRLNGIVAQDASGWSGAGSPLRIRAVGPTVPSRASAPNGGSPAPAAGAAPLAGVRVIDFGSFVAGPYASKLLADYGADVIQVEPPAGRATLSGERTIISALHGKRSICIDAKSASGREVIARLCAGADIVLHNFRPGVGERLGLDPATLRGINPGLVTLETTAYGPTGPKSRAPGFDMVIQAHCGLEIRAGGAGNPPLCCRSPLVDFATGAVGAIGLLVGLYERLASGRAVTVETNLLNVGVYMMSELVRAPDGSWQGAAPLDGSQTGFHPAESLYRTADGWIAIAVRSATMAQALASLLDIAVLPAPGQWGAAERERIAAAMALRGTAALQAQLDAAGVWAEACVRDAWHDAPPQSAVMRTLPDAQYGRVHHCIGPLVQFSRSPTALARRLAFAPGADTTAVLDELGVPGHQLDAWFAAGAVADEPRRRPG